MKEVIMFTVIGFLLGLKVGILLTLKLLKK